MKTVEVVKRAAFLTVGKLDNTKTVLVKLDNSNENIKDKVDKAFSIYKKLINDESIELIDYIYLGNVSIPYFTIIEDEAESNLSLKDYSFCLGICSQCPTEKKKICDCDYEE